MVAAATEATVVSHDARPRLRGFGGCTATCSSIHRIQGKKNRAPREAQARALDSDTAYRRRVGKSPRRTRTRTSLRLLGSRSARRREGTARSRSTRWELTVSSSRRPHRELTVTRHGRPRQGNVEAMAGRRRPWYRVSDQTLPNTCARAARGEWEEIDGSRRLRLQGPALDRGNIRADDADVDDESLAQRDWVGRCTRRSTTARRAHPRRHGQPPRRCIGH